MAVAFKVGDRVRERPFGRGWIPRVGTITAVYTTTPSKNENAREPATLYAVTWDGGRNERGYFGGTFEQIDIEKV